MNTHASKASRNYPKKEHVVRVSTKTPYFMWFSSGYVLCCASIARKDWAWFQLVRYSQTSVSDKNSGLFGKVNKVVLNPKDNKALWEK